MRTLQAMAARIGARLRRNQSEEAPQASEMRFRALTENSSDIIAILDRDGHLQYASPSSRILGYEPGELLGRSTFDYLHHEDEARARHAFGRAVAGDTSGIVEEFRVRHKDGSWRTLEAVVSNLLDMPAVKGIVINCRDVTERERTSAQLRSQERQLQAIVDAVNDVVLELDGEGRYLNIWAADESELARPRTELLGKRVEDVLGLDAARPLAEPLRRVLSTGVPESLEYPLPLADGEHWFLGRLTRLPGIDGGPDSVCMGITDISERKRAEEALKVSEAEHRGLIERAPLGIYRTTPEGRLLAANAAFARMLGYEGPDELLDRDMAQVVYASPDERARLLSRLGPQDDFATETQWKRKDGTSVVVRLNIHVVRGPTRGIECFEGLAEDVTEQRNLEAQFRQAQRLEAVGRLAGGVAHDFNNILTAITGYSELLLADLAADDRRREDVEEIRTATQRAAALTRQLLAFSRRQVLQVKVLDLNVVVRTLDRMLRRLIGEDVSLEVALSDGLGAVRADPAQMEQIIMNLAVNARDAMPVGGRLTIESANVVLDETYARVHGGAKPGRYVMLAVSDTGVGMDDVTRSHIFEPFFTTKEPSKGTGLGLATVYGIVKQSGGNIWVYSEPGRGATFRLYMPRVDQQPEDSEQQATLPVAGGHETVLLAEDDASVREVVARALEQMGYRVLRASDGQVALDLARAHSARIALLATDLVMPGMTGRELALALLAERPDLRVIYMSGYADQAVVRHGVLEKGLPYLQKPFSVADLVRKVREVLDAP